VGNRPVVAMPPPRRGYRIPLRSIRGYDPTPLRG